MIIEAILKINPKAQVSVSGKDINTCEIEWLNGTTPISKAVSYTHLTLPTNREV